MNALTKAMTAEKSHAESRAQVLQLREVVASLELAVNRSEIEAVSIVEAKEALTRQLRGVVDDKSDIQARLAEKITEAESLQALLVDAHAREQKVQRTAAEATSQLQSQVDALLREKNEWESVASSSQAEQLVAASRFQSQCSSLQTQLETVTLRAASEEKRRNEESEVLQRQMEALRASSASERERMTAECVSLQSQLVTVGERSKSSFEDWQSKHALLQERFVLAQQESHTERERLVADQQIKLLNLQQLNLVRAEEMAQEHTNQAKALVSAHEEALRKAEQAHLSAVMTQQQHYNVMIDELSSEKETASRLLEDTQTQLLQLQAVLSAAEKANTRYEQQLVAHTASLDATQIQFVALQTQLMQVEQAAEKSRVVHERVLQENSVQMQKLQSELLASESAKCRYEGQIVAHTTSLDATQKQFALLQNQLLQLELEADKTSAAHQLALQKNAAQIAHLQEALVAAEHAKVGYEQQVVSRTASLDSTQGQFSALQSQLARLEREAEKSRAAHETALEHALQEASSLEEALTAKERSVVSLESQVAAVEAEVAQKAHLAHSLEGKLREVTFLVTNCFIHRRLYYF